MPLYRTESLIVRHAYDIDESRLLEQLKLEPDDFTTRPKAVRITSHSCMEGESQYRLRAA